MARFSKGLAWIKENIGHQSDDCLIWPYARSRGYGIYGIDKKTYKAHRVMCEMVHGLPPTDKHHAAHSCGNGHLGCVNPQHLSWKTPAENCLDRRKHGTQATNQHGGRTILAADKIDEILRLKGTLSLDKMAKKFGTSRQTVTRIYEGKQYLPFSQNIYNINRRLKKQREKQNA